MNAPVQPSAPNASLDELSQRARAFLLRERDVNGRWTGELSTSALSTAVAICAFKALLAAESRHPEAAAFATLIDGGLRWLADHQNADGGWGDTVISFSNISTTALVWSAFAGDDERFAATTAACEGHLARAIGAVASPLDAKQLAAAVVKRYGTDHTFSVPILTTLAFMGRLGPARDAWPLVPQLPFELAAFPRSWYARLGLPVVSYALPALIAIGQLKHRLAPTWNRPWRFLRDRLIPTTLRTLEQIQPASGGYLEAAPLTGFVAMSLIGAGRAGHPVTRNALKFLRESVRRDGSWPIDTNLATWVTTLATNALQQGCAHSPKLSESDHFALRSYLVEQQSRDVHPFTRAAPGAWAWTNLSGGVPDADDTSGALLALHALDDGAEATRRAAAAGVEWLLDLQNADGGIPTFCRGWGKLPFDRSSADITAHALRAWDVWQAQLPVAVQPRVERATQRALRYLQTEQRPDGSWAPLWFGNQHLAEETNCVYGTSRVLLALSALQAQNILPARDVVNAERGRRWLLEIQNADGGWGGGANTPSSIEETALALEALATALDNSAVIDAAIARGISALDQLTRQGAEFPASPIGFYFAKLWYFERLYPAVFTVAALARVRSRLQR